MGRRGLDVVVVGSLNVDHVVRVRARPGAGETVLGHGRATGPGGKGGNQAVAAARAGARVAMVGAVGADADGDVVLAALAAAGVDTTRVARGGEPTGAAFITVDDAGENAIVVAPGANHALTPETIGPLPAAAVLLAQGELPAAVVAAALARRPAARAVLNLAPVIALPPAAWTAVDVLVVNRGEAGAVLGAPVGDEVPDALAAAAALTRLGPGAAVVTLGALGAVVADGGPATHVPAAPVEVVDTTGAGDAFTGALAAELARDRPLAGAVAEAVAAGARAVGWPGAQRPVPEPEPVA